MDVKDKLDKGWRSIDHDGDGFGFDSFMGKGLVGRLDLDPEDYTEQGAEKSADCLISWGTFLPMLAPVSYTHLDVYKRQMRTYCLAW